MTKKKQQYDRLQTASVEETLEAIGNAIDVLKSKNMHQALLRGFKGYRTPFKGEEVHLTSLRLLTFFNQGVVCSCCGLKASYFAFERNPITKKNPKPGSYHLNLWGVDEEGEERMFTHDHTLARALGGNDDATNTTTMCLECNGEKAKEEYLLCLAKREKERQAQSEVEAV